MALVLITHDMGVVAETADRVIVQYNGRKMEERRRPVRSSSGRRTPYTRALLSALPENATGGRLPTVSDYAPAGQTIERPARRARDPRHRPPDYRVGAACSGAQRLVRALKGIDLKVDRGKPHPRGGGRVRLRQVDAGAHHHHDRPPSGGMLLIDGKDVDAASDGVSREMRRKVQIVFQNPYGSLNPRQKIGDVLARAPGSQHRPRPPPTGATGAMAMLVKVGLKPEHFNRYPHMFSGGQRQRIAIARAVMVHPVLLVLDEPVSALDLSVQAQILNLLQDLQDEFSLTYVFISHDLSVVRHVADEVMVMNLGEAVEYRSRDAIFAAPEHPYTRTLFAATPIIDTGRIRARVEAKAARVAAR